MHALGPGAVWVDLTTNSRELVLELASAAPHGVAVVDSPVTGAVDGARRSSTPRGATVWTRARCVSPGALPMTPECRCAWKATGRHTGRSDTENAREDVRTRLERPRRAGRTLPGYGCQSGYCCQAGYMILFTCCLHLFAECHKEHQP